MNPSFPIIQTMKSIRYILAISFITIIASSRIEACGPYYPDDPANLHMFRSCSPELEHQWQNGCRFQDYERYENCLLWQRLTSPDIPLKDIEEVVYDSQLKDLKGLPESTLSGNRFAQWLSSPEHSEDLEYVLTAKEIEEIRDYMNDPWYYSYDGDDEHVRLDELLKRCQDYSGNRHAERYALQLMRLFFAKKDFSGCIGLWESSVSGMPQNIVTDMIASYAGGAYTRKGDRDKAIELFTRSQDIGSLISLKAWNNSEERSNYKDSRVKELEYIFNRFPNSPLLSVKLQGYVRDRESFLADDPLDADDEREFYDELKQFAGKAAASSTCEQKGMWHYALAYLAYLDGDNRKASKWLSHAEKSETTPFIKESVKAFRFLLNACQANNSSRYRAGLLKDLAWLDGCMQRDVKLQSEGNWHFDNRLNWPFYYWQDVARKVLLGEVCPRIEKAGNTTLALQLANYASNRISQLAPWIKAYHYGWNDKDEPESYSVMMTMEEYRKNWAEYNSFDYRNQFFDRINGVSADKAAEYAKKIIRPETESDRFLNERSYTDNDYIFEIVGTSYLREMNYEKATEWLSKVSKGYQSRTNIAKKGYFKLDPFKYQSDRKNYISDSNDYKLRFAQEMLSLERMMDSETEPNRKANAKIRYAVGLRNSFGKCWYLTGYSYELGYEHDADYSNWEMYTSGEREGFKKNLFAQNAYRKVDALMSQALSEFTDTEQAAQAHLEMKNFATLMKRYPSTMAANRIRGRCDRYHDYSLHKR